MEKRSRRVFLLSAIGLGAGVLGTPLYIRFVEPRWLQLDRRQIPVGPKRLALPIRILHLSDFHVSGLVPYKFIERALDLGLRQKPDLICLTGDYIVRHLERAEEYRRILRKLSSAAPTFTCFGNHDGGSWAQAYGGYSTLAEMSELLRASGIACLLNEAQTVTIRGLRLGIVGLGDLWAGQIRPEQALTAKRRDDIPIIVLCHNPDAKELLANYDWDLMLSGHTHGGQLRLPFIGTPYAPVRDQNFVEGLHQWNGRWIYITRGVGNLHGMRFNCRPQVSVLRLV